MRSSLDREIEIKGVILSYSCIKTYSLRKLKMMPFSVSHTKEYLYDIMKLINGERGWRC